MEPLSCCSFQGSVAGIPPKRQTRSTRVSKKAVTSPSQLPSELPTTLAPTPLALPLPLPLKQPTPTPSDVDVDMLVGGGEYILADSAQHLLVCSPFNKLSPRLMIFSPYSTLRNRPPRYHANGFTHRSISLPRIHFAHLRTRRTLPVTRTHEQQPLRFYQFQL